MKLVIVVFLSLIGIAEADRKEPAWQTGARTFLKVVLESKDTPAATAAKPIHFVSNDNECGDSGKAVDDKTAKQLKACVQAARKRFDAETVAEMAATDVKLAKMLGEFEGKQHAAIKAAVKDTKIVRIDWSGNGEGLSIFVAVAKDNTTIKGVYVTSEPVE
jgi:hypothetical protein